MITQRKHKKYRLFAARYLFIYYHIVSLHSETQKGKLEELNVFLSGGGMGGLPLYAQDFYEDEPWVEFIEVDAKDPDTGEKEDSQSSDTQRLLGLSQPVSHDANTGCSNAARYCTGPHLQVLD